MMEMEDTSEITEAILLESWSSEELVSDFEESLTLRYANEKVDVSVGMEVRHHKIEMVDSPSLFIAKLDGKGDKLVENWRNAFDAFYSNKEASFEHTLRTKTPIKDRCYACLDPLRHTWERVRLLDVNVFSSSARVFFCDTLDIRPVPVHNLRELIPPFGTFPACAFYASLVDIRPKTEDGEQMWSKDAIEFFKDWVKGKSFKTLVLGQVGILFPAAGVPAMLPHFGVCIIDESPEDEVECSLQAELIKSGFAEGDGPFSSFPGMLDLSDEGKEVMYTSWNIVEDPGSLEDEEDSSGRFNVDDGRKETIEGIGKVIRKMREMSLEEEDANNKENPKATKEKSSSEMNLEFEQMKTLAGALENLLSCRAKNFAVPKEFLECVGVVKISHVISPSWMYVQFWGRLKKLKEMEESLRRIVEPMPEIPVVEKRTGIHIACFCEVAEDDFVWGRAVVKAFLPIARLIKVLMVDYGLEISVAHGNARYLPCDFESVPSFAHRVFLNFTHLIPSRGPSWDSESRATFRRNVDTDDAEATYFLRLQRESVFSLRSFRQEMSFKGGVWVPGEVPQRLSYAASMIKVIDAQRNEPMLINFYTTFGVELLRQVEDTCDRFALKFVLLDGLLKEKGCAIDKRELPDVATA